jgi:hypothetical protein
VPYGKLFLVEQFAGRESYMSISVDMDGIKRRFNIAERFEACDVCCNVHDKCAG